MADEEHRGPEEISVRLEWPIDPLAATPSDMETDPVARLEARLAALESRGVTDGGSLSREVSEAIEDVSTRLDYLGTELVDALRHLNDGLMRAVRETTATIDDRVAGLRTAMMAMLASRQAEEQRTQRRDRDVLVTKIEEGFAHVAAELQALRRRIPVKGRSSSLDDRTIEDIAMRVSDEVEIRMAAALKPKPGRKS